MAKHKIKLRLDPIDLTDAEYRVLINKVAPDVSEVIKPGDQIEIISPIAGGTPNYPSEKLNIRGDLTLEKLEKSVTPFVSALNELQHIIDDIRGIPKKEVIVREITDLPYGTETSVEQILRILGRETEGITLERLIQLLISEKKAIRE